MKQRIWIVVVGIVVGLAGRWLFPPEPAKSTSPPTTAAGPLTTIQP